MRQNNPKTYLQELNGVQRGAVTTTEGPVLVIAGPGSGKTRVLTYRIAHLIEEGTAPWEILALTFTNKAAREMKDRIAKVVGDRGRRVWAGTFHSIFARILRVEAEKIGFPSNFSIYDTSDSKSLLTAIMREMNLDKKVYNVNAVRTRISSAKSNLISPRAYAQDTDLMQQDRISKRPLLYQIYAKYMLRCRRAGAMDFDDLLYQLYVLLYKNPDGVLEKYQKRFRYLLVDEFQDTNHLQYSIVRKLINFEGSPRNICVVGDDAQSIYAFRGATIQNILDFEQDFKPHGIKVFKLEQNYRSTHHIVETANKVITHNGRQIFKKIWSAKTGGQKIKVIRAINDKEEGRQVINVIMDQKNRDHLGNREIAILYRTNAQSRIFEEYLRKYNIPYKVFGGLSFYQRKEVKDLIAYLRLAVNPRDEEALRRVINFPKRGIGKATIEKISDFAGSADQSMWDCLTQVKVSTRSLNGILKFKSLIESFISQSGTMNAYELANFIAKDSGLIKLLKSDTTIEGMGRLENLQALLDGVSAFVDEDTIIDTETIPDKSLASYLQNIALLTDSDEKSNQEDYVTLMSVHSAKGLEYKSVFVVGLEENLFPSFLSMNNLEGVEEERRLFYVAITRAEQFLTLSCAKNRYRYGNNRENDPSRFLEEIPDEHVENRTFGKSNQQQASLSHGARVQGNFTQSRKAKASSLKADPNTFAPSPGDQVQVGMKVLHLRFGEGKVLAIDGSRDNRVATIHFGEEDNPQKRIVLKYSKLQIL